MTNDIERYRGTDLQQTAEVDSWTQILGPVADLAQKIAQTEFVPDSLRGKTAAVAAAILAGREMNVPPMTALQHIHVIKGKPGQSAQLMRQLVLAAGHQLRYVETTDTRCVVEGRRKGEEEWQQVSFTADQARKAKIDLGSYPEDKLVARATSRLCRRAFADVLGGMPYTVEELEDGEDAPRPVAAAEPEKPARRTARRRTVTATRVKPEPAPESEPQQDSPEPGFGDDPTPEPTGSDDPVTKPQLTKLAAIFTEHNITDRDIRLKISSSLADRDLSSAKDLTKAEATTVIDALESLASTGNLSEVVVEMLDGDAQDMADDAARDEAAAEA